MHTLLPCPTRDDLERFLLGHGDAEASSGLEEHLSQCPACAAAAESLTAEDELLATVKRASTREDTPEPASVQSLVSVFRHAFRDRDPAATMTHVGAAPSAPSEAVVPAGWPEPGATFGHYEIRGVLGAGGMGVVYQGYDPTLRRDVALKVVKKEWVGAPGMLDRFLAEARAVAAVEHDNIVVVHAVEVRDGVPCLVMPLLRGESLAAKFAGQAEPLPLPATIALARDALNGLAAAHARGLIHRDIKPGNLWVEAEGGTAARGGLGRVKVLDFGLAVAGEAAAGGFGGTPGYMAPEQIRGGALDARADLFSVGCVLYRAATGTLPFDGTSATDCLVKTVTRDPAPAREVCPSLPPALADLIDRLLAKEPTGRPDSADAVLLELAAIEDAAAARRRRLTRRRWLGGIAAAAMAGGFGAWFFAPAGVPELPPVAVDIRHDPDITKLILSRDGTEMVVELPKDAKVKLTPGEYNLRLPADVPGRKLEPATITVLPDTPAAVAISLPGEVAVSKAHDGPVAGVVAVTGAEKGSLVVLSASQDRTLSPWVVGGKPLPQLARLTSPARVFAATPDGRLVATAGGNKQQPTELGVQLWDGRTLQPLGPPLEGHTRQVTAVAVAADGSRLVSASAGEVWLRTLGQQRREELVGHGDARVTAAAVDATGKFALTGDDAGFLALWDATAARLIKRIVGQAVGEIGAVRAVAFTADGFVSAGDDGVIRVWDRTTFKAREFPARPKPLLCLAVSPDGKRLLSGGGDGTVTLWSLPEARVLATFTGHPGAANAVGFTPDGTGAVSGGADRSVRLWRLPIQ